MRVLITGATGGIGEAIAIHLSRPENLLFLTAHPSEEFSGQQIIEKCRQAGVATISAGYGDVSCEDTVKKIHAKAVRDLGGPIDVLICNAGIGRWGLLEHASSKDFDDMFSVNVKGVFLWIREVLPGMKERNFGSIVVISSKLGFEPKPRAAIYCATKHALQGLVNSLRLEVLDRQSRIKVCTVCPGAVNTQSKWIAGDERNVAKERMLQPVDVAKAVDFVLNQSCTSNIDLLVLKPQTDYTRTANNVIIASATTTAKL